MSESQLITLGWCYELAKPEKAKAIRQKLNDHLKEFEGTDFHWWYIHLFERGRQEARSN